MASERAGKLVAHLQKSGAVVPKQKIQPVSCSSALQSYDDQKYDLASTALMYFEEQVTPSLTIRMILKDILYQGHSKFQTVKVIETVDFGKTLVLDGKTQSSKRDEFVYHECLVHPAMMLHQNPKTVYIGGGGELATAREVLRHKSVEKVVMVDIDETVVEISRKELPEWGDGCTEDPRLEVHYDDAKSFLENYDGTFDVIVMDIADPIEAGPGIVLYTQEFYKFASTKLNPGGIIVTQAGPCGLLTYHECFTVISNTLKSVFDNVTGYAAEVPSFSGPWGFTIAFNNCPEMGLPAHLDVKMLAHEVVDKKIEERLKNVEEKPLRFYDGVCHHGIFGLPKFVRDAVKGEERIMTIENPVFMF